MCLAHSLEQIPLAKAQRFRSTHAAGTSFVEANDNALPLRTVIHNVLRLAGRLALTKLWSIVHASRPVALSFGANGLRVIKRRPRAITKVSYSRPFMSCVPINCGTVRPVLIATGR